MDFGAKFLLPAALQPGGHVFGLLKFERVAGEIQRKERVHHHSQLPGLLLSNGSFCHAGLRTMSQTIRMHADVAAVDPFARHEIAFGIIDHFI